MLTVSLKESSIKNIYKFDSSEEGMLKNVAIGLANLPAFQAASIFKMIGTSY